MPKHVRLALAALITLAATQCGAASRPPSDCQSEWALSTRGIAIGSASDRVQVGGDGSITVWSDFRPNSLLAMFGVDPARREFVLDAQGRASRRTETRGGSRPETNRWQRRDDGEWERSLNGIADKHATPAQSLVIDSTSFPYLLHLELVAAQAASQPVAVVAKGKVYPATLTVRPQDAATEAWVVDFGSTEGQGRAWLDRDLKPLRVEFTDEHGTLHGALEKWECH